MPTSHRILQKNHAAYRLGLLSRTFTLHRDLFAEMPEFEYGTAQGVCLAIEQLADAVLSLSNDISTNIYGEIQSWIADQDRRWSSVLSMVWRFDTEDRDWDSALIAGVVEDGGLDLAQLTDLAMENVGVNRPWFDLGKALGETWLQVHEMADSGPPPPASLLTAFRALSASDAEAIPVIAVIVSHANKMQEPTLLDLLIEPLASEHDRIHLQAFGTAATQMVLNRLFQKLDDEIQAWLENHGGSVRAESKAKETTDATYCWRLRGDTWEVCFGSECGLFQDHKRMRYVAKLLASADKAIPALELMGTDFHDKAAVRNVQPVEQVQRAEKIQPQQSFQATLDKDAIEEYQAELIKLSNQIEKARDAKNDATVEKLERDYETIETELRKSTGLRNRPRQLGPASNEQQARDAIRKALERTCETLEKATPAMTDLARHLLQSIQLEGTSYAYRPSPSVKWLLE